jgi:hypothetical protein
MMRAPGEHGPGEVTSAVHSVEHHHSARRAVRAALLGAVAFVASAAPAAAYAAAHSSDPASPSAPRPGEAPSIDATAGEADRLLRRWAPTFVQAVEPDDAGRDRPMRIDFDGDWDATNNWDNQPRHWRDTTPVVYGSAILTDSHAYLTYTLFYPRDWSALLCIPWVCHDNDLEVAQVVVERDGEVVLVETKTHSNFITVSGATLSRDSRGRPMLAVESQGHGITACVSGDASCAPLPGRILYALGGASGTASDAALGQTTGYELMPLHETLWARRGLSGEGRHLWESKEPLTYAGVAPEKLMARLGTAMAGRRYAGGVRPPWGVRAEPGARGEWFLNPAAVLWRRHPELLGRHGSPSLRYLFNPFADDLVLDCARGACAVSPLQAGVGPTGTAAGALLGLGLGLVRWRLVRRRSPVTSGATIARS